MSSHPDLFWMVAGGFLTAAVAVMGTVAGKAVTRGCSRVLAALVEIGRLPDVVSELITELRSLRGHLSELGDRVKHLEEMAGGATVTADRVSISTTPTTPEE
jgi:hypothetical protein